MSVPVAGRRKGVNPSASPTSAAPPSSELGGGPSWLDDLDTAPTRSPPPPVSVVQAPVSAAGAATYSRDPLAFLGDGDDGGRAGVSPASATSLPWFDDASPPAALRTIPTRGTTAAAPLASPSGSPMSIPAFLQSDTDAVYGASPLSASPAPSSPVPPVVMVDVRQAERAREQAQRADLRQQLSELDRQHREAARRVEELQGNGHPLAVDVAALESALAALREQEAAARQQKADREAAAEAARAAASAVTAAASDGDETATNRELRRECVRRAEEEVDRLTAAVQAQQERTAALQVEWEAAVAHDTDDSRQSAVLETLLQRIRDGARHFKRHIALQCGSVVAESARTQLAAARRQRADVFASDAAARVKTLAEHQARCATGAAAFHEQCHRDFQARADSAFGAVKVAVEAAHRQQHAEQCQRVASFQSQLASAAERQREVLAHQLHRRVEQEYGIAATQRDAAARELTSRLEELSAQRRTFRLRAAAELSALRERRGESDALGGGRVRPPAPTTASPGVSKEALRSDMSRVRAQMEQLAVSLRAKCLSQKAASTPPSTTGAAVARASSVADWSTLSGGRLRSGTPGPAPALAQMEESWQSAVVVLQHNREALRRGVAELGEATRRCAGQLQHHRTEATRHREEVKGVRGEWEQTIRHQLSRCFSAAGAEVPPAVSLTTNTLANLGERVASMAQAQQSLRVARTAFTGEVNSWAESLQSYRAESERLLRDIFGDLELLRGRSVEVEVGQLTLQSLQAQVDILEQQLTEATSQLALRKRYIEAAVQELRAGALTARDSAAVTQGAFDAGARLRQPHDAPVAQVYAASAAHSGAQRSKLPASCSTADAAARTGGTAAAAAPPNPASAAAAMQSASSAATPSVVAHTAGSSGIGGAGGSVTLHPSAVTSSRVATGGSTALTTTQPVPTAGGTVLSSGSPSPIMPSLHGTAGWSPGQAYSAGGFGGGGFVPVPASARHTTTATPAADQSDDEPESYREDDPDFSTDLVPLEDDDDSLFDPLLSYTR